MRERGLLAGCCLAVAVAVAACAGSMASMSNSAHQDLTPTERRDLDLLMRNLQAPCLSAAMSVAQCTQTGAACPGCAAAARFLYKAVREGRSRQQVETLYGQRFGAAEPKPIDLSDAPMMGNASAAVTIVEFADFQCPYCSTTVQVLDRIVQQYAPHVRLVFKHAPLQYHSNAELAARAAVAAQRQGRFWEMHHLLFQNQRALTAPDIDQYAREAGLDLERFHADLGSPETAARVKRDVAEGKRIGVDGTPTVFVNGRPFSIKYFDLSVDLADWVQAEIEITTGRLVEPAASSSGAALAPWAPVESAPVVATAPAPSTSAPASAVPSPKGQP